MFALQCLISDNMGSNNENRVLAKSVFGDMIENDQLNISSPTQCYS